MRTIRQLHSCHVMEYPLALPNGGLSSNCKVASRSMVFPLLALGVSAPFVTWRKWRTLIIYSFDAALLNPAWEHCCAMLICSLVELSDPTWNAPKMYWLGYMLSKLCNRAVDDVAASKGFAVLPALEQMSMLRKFHVYFCLCVFACFFNFICQCFPFTPNRESQCTVSLKHKSPWDAAHSGSQRSQCNLM